MSDRVLHVEVVSRIGSLWHGNAAYVSIPAVDGRLGILPGRQPVLAVLESGEVEIKGTDSKKIVVAVDSGFASVDSDFVTIVVDKGEVSS